MQRLLMIKQSALESKNSFAYVRVVMDEDVWSRLIQQKEPALLAVSLSENKQQSPSLNVLKAEEKFDTHGMDQRKPEETSSAFLKNEAHLQAIIDSGPDCIKLLDNEGRILNMNPAGLQMVEADSFADIAEQSVYQLIAEEFHPNFRQLSEAVFRGESGKLEFRITGLKGTDRWLETHVSPMWDASGQISAMLAITRDITIRKRTLADYNNLDARLRLATETANIGLWDWTLNTNEVFFSKEWKRQLGYCDNEISNNFSEWETRVHLYDLPVVLERLQAYLKDPQGTFESELRLRHKDGTYRWIYTQADVLRDESERPIRMLGCHIDITERKKAETNLAQKEARYRQIVETANEGIWTVDAEGYTTFVNPQMARMLGLSASQMTGCHYSDFMNEGTRESADAVFSELRQGISNQHGLCFQHVDGKDVWTLLNTNPLLDQKGEFAGALAMVTDITQQKKDQFQIQKLIRTHAVLSDINQMIVRERDRQTIMDAACKIAIDQGEFGLAWIGIFDPENQRIRVAAQSLAEGNNPSTLRSFLGDRGNGGQLVHKAFETGQHVVCDNILTDPRCADWRDAAAVLGYASMISMPLSVDGNTIGTFNLYAYQADFFDEAEIRLMDELAIDVGFALYVCNREQERQTANQRLIESEQRFRELADTIEECFWIADIANDHMLYVSPAYEKLWGLSCQSLYENPDSWRYAIHPEDRERVLAAKADRSTTGGRQIEYRITRPNGQERWIRDWAYVAEGGPDGTVREIGVARDVTEQRIAEQELIRREEYFRLLLENASDLITVVSTTGTIRYQSPSGQKALGFKAEEMVGSNLFDYIHKDDVQVARAAFEEMMNRTDKQSPVEYRFKHRDGSWRLLESVGQSIEYTSEKDIIVVNSRDVTETRQLESQYRQSQKMEAIGQLAGGVAHDFNNILAAIMMQVELVAIELRDKYETCYGLQDITSYASKAADLTRQLLLFSRRQVMRLRYLDLNEVVTSLSRMLDRIIGEDVEMELKLHPKPLIVRGDAGMLDQILMNLTVNARDAMKNGGVITIETGAETIQPSQQGEAQAGSYVWISVSDSGGGISADVLPHVFEPFFSTKELGKGTGLGLATVFGIVQQHGGDIVASNCDMGACFKVRLPAQKAEFDTRLAEAPALPSTGGTETILLVEDDKSVQKLSFELLKHSGYQVLRCSSGPEALELWRKTGTTIDLLFTDLVMPGGMTGSELAAQLKEQNPRLKVVYCSGYSPDQAGKDLKLKRGEVFVQKPFQAAMFLETIRKCLDE